MSTKIRVTKYIIKALKKYNNYSLYLYKYQAFEQKKTGDHF